MKKAIFISILSAMVCFGAFGSWAAEMGHANHDMAATHGKENSGFKHNAVADGVRAEFQIMTLESMNMKGENGDTHHVMVKFIDEETGRQMKQAKGKIKVISPSKGESVGSLKDYSGTFAANFSAKEEGKYGIICLFAIDGKKRIVKFWYQQHG